MEKSYIVVWRYKLAGRKSKLAFRTLENAVAAFEAISESTSIADTPFQIQDEEGNILF